jgi:hypothetical protein
MFKFNVVDLFWDRFDLLNHSLSFLGARLASAFAKLRRDPTRPDEADLLVLVT